MPLIGSPIPPRPATFTPEGAPPGVAVNFEALRGADGRPWYLGRQTITPRLTLVHTNAASGESSLQASINWGNAASANTKPHYHVNAPQPTKVVPTNRRAIANATVDAYQDGHGDVAEWSIAIETADAGFGTGKPGEAGGFLYDHAEIVARILAYESIVWNIPLSYPTEWFGTGTACHTEPFEYPHWTLYRGKTCPGREKKRQIRDEILPRAREIRAAWLTPNPPVEDDDMRLLDIPPMAYSTRPTDTPLTVGPTLAARERREIPLPFADGARQARLNIKVIPIDGPDPDTLTDPGWIRLISPTVPAGKATHSSINWSPGDMVAGAELEVGVAGGKVVIENGPAACNIIVDVIGYVPVG